MHYGAVFRIASQQVWHNFAKCLRKKPLVNVADGVMNVFFGSGYASLVIAIGTHSFDLYKIIKSLLILVI
jgi:hypothetical protein